MNYPQTQSMDTPNPSKYKYNVWISVDEVFCSRIIDLESNIACTNEQIYSCLMVNHRTEIIFISYLISVTWKTNIYNPSIGKYVPILFGVQGTQPGITLSYLKLRRDICSSTSHHHDNSIPSWDCFPISQCFT